MRIEKQRSLLYSNRRSPIDNNIAFIIIWFAKGYHIFICKNINSKDINLLILLSKSASEIIHQQNTKKRIAGKDTDNKDNFETINISKNTTFNAIFEPALLNGVTIASDGNKQIKFIPYYIWDNRKAREMNIWIDYKG